MSNRKQAWLVPVVSGIALSLVVGCRDRKPETDAPAAAVQPPVPTMAEAVQGPAEPVPQTLCPVMGVEIDREVYTDYDEHRIYFCCPVCIERFLDNVDHYLEQMKARNIQLEKIPTIMIPADDDWADADADDETVFEVTTEGEDW